MDDAGQNKKFKSDDGGNISSNGDVPRSKRVYVANVPFDVKVNELKDLFREKIGEVTHCTIFENEDGKSRGCGLIEFQDIQTAARAIEMMHRSEFKNRELVVKEDLDCERDRFGRIITGHGSRNRDDSQRRDGSNREGGRSGGGGGGRDRGDRRRDVQQQSHHQNNSNNNYGYDHSIMSNAFAPQQPHNTFGLSQQFLDSLSISLPLNNRIFVANLEYKVDQDKLEEIFKLAGKVAKVKLSTDQQGQSRGYGTVEYEHPVEAVQAISMFHNQKLYGRTMSVRMDKYECEDDIETIPSKLPSGLEGVGKGLGINGQPLNVAKSIMNAALIAPPHLAPMAGQSIPPQMHPPAVQQPAAMQQAVIAAQMQQLQQQHQQHQQQQQQHLLPQTAQQALPPTMQHQLQQSLQQNPLQQQYQMQLSQPQQALQQAPMSAYSTMQQIQAANAVRPPQASAANVYQQPQQAPPNNQQPAAQSTQQTATSAPVNNLSVFSTFERQFREASSAPQNFTRN